MKETSMPEISSPITGMHCDFRQYVKDKKAIESQRMSGNGLPDYAYSFDYEFRKKLDAIPHLYSLARKYCATVNSRSLQEINRQGLLVGPNQFSEVYEIGCDCAKILGIAIPNIYIINNPSMNARTMATDDIEPIIIIYSGLYERLRKTPDELRCVIGHECGHIHNKHGVYDALKAYIALGGINAGLRLFPNLLKLMTTSTDYLLKAWSRAAEVTCDRAAMICCERIEDAYSVNAKLLYGATFGNENAINMEAIKQQLQMQQNTIARLKELEEDHPVVARRIAAEMEFAECEVLYRWRPDLKTPGQRLRSKEETDERCHAVIDVIAPNKAQGEN